MATASVLARLERVSHGVICLLAYKDAWTLLCFATFELLPSSIHRSLTHSSFLSLLP